MRSGETTAFHSSPCCSSPAASVASRRGHGSATRDDREPRLVVALDGDHERRVVDPHGRAQLAEFARRAARRAGRPTRGRPARTRPASRRGRAAGRCPPSRAPGRGRGSAARASGASRSSSQTSEVSRSWMKTRVPAVGAEGERARPLGRGDGLEPPVRRRLDVLALGHRDAFVLVLADPQRWLSHAQPPRLVRSRCPRARPAPAHRSWSRRSRPPARRRSGARAPRAPCPPARKPSAVTASGLSGSPAAASTPSATTSAAGSNVAAHQLSSCDGRDPRLVAAPRGEREVAVGAARAVLAGQAEEVREPAGGGVDVDRAGDHAGVAPRRSPARRCRGARRRRGSRPAPERLAQRGGGDRGVVEVAAAAVGAAGHVVARRAAAGVRGGLALEHERRRR